MDAIAIDGPAASGKTAVGSALAKRLGYAFLDTGAMYRALTWAALERGIDPADEGALAAFAEGASIDVRVADESSAETRVIIDGEDATPHLREPRVEQAVSAVSRVAGVRTVLVRIQRALAGDGRIVMAGRDIGSVVIPDARLKVYLDASRPVRARRRAAQIEESGGTADLAGIAADLARRDGVDAAREVSPLTAAAGAVIINTDGMDIGEVLRRLVTLAHG